VLPLRHMAKSTKISRSSASKTRSSKSLTQAVKPGKRALVRSAPRSAPAPVKKAARQGSKLEGAKKPAPAKPAGSKPIATRAEPTLSAASQRVRSSPLLEALSPNERRAVQQALAGKSTLLTSTPRARDAAVFAAAASAAPQPVLVASPLAAELVELTAMLPGLDVAALGSFVAPATEAASKKRLLRGGPLLVVVEPGRLFDPELQQLAGKVSLSLVGIAAAHACSEHAHELSPAYLSLRDALRAFSAPVLATCTATTTRVIEQVSEAIGSGSDPERVITAEAPELDRAAQVVRATERKTALFSAILAYGAPGVVLTATSQEADMVYGELTTRKVPCVRAHTGMSPAERSAAITRFSEARDALVLVTQSPHANASGLAGCPEATQCLGSAAPRGDLRFVVHYQAPLSPEQLFEDLAWLRAGMHSLVLADSSDSALIQALLAQQRVKPAAIDAMAQALAQAAGDRPAFADTLALRAGTSRRSAERVLGAFADRNLIVRDNGQISRRASPEQLGAEGRLLSARFAALRAADTARAEVVARYVTSRHGTAPSAPVAQPDLPRHVRA
jgi:hypothetical protein